MQNPAHIEARVEARHRTLLFLWFGILMSMSLFLGLTMFVPNQNPEPNSTLSFVFIGLAFMGVMGSILIKRRVVQSAIEKRDSAMLQTGYILGFALCESAALWGVIDHFVAGSRYYYFSFVLGLLGMLKHFPKKDHVRAATA
jgi:F0F1-type ATP synthase membrane subunit c/vacuolar-type H+-ATPase subunit K